MARRHPARVDPPHNSNWWTATSSRVRHSTSAGCLVVLAFSFYGPALFPGKELIGGDTRQWSAVAESMLQHRETTDEEPLWATNTFAGMPGYVISPPPRVPQIDIVVGLAALDRLACFPLCVPAPGYLHARLLSVEKQSCGPVGGVCIRPYDLPSDHSGGRAQHKVRRSLLCHPGYCWHLYMLYADPV